ncbi:hypothetical protein GALMADRAFT_75145 [Galerina marginata CBS 339.88]|uniref:PA14 domain-containing protein n=1 Tax=Galerina marginata (strain CBS 339.88) TaxID=685588 RepID=A0A067SJY8_GALM3|nr:hypothetical protein GALMADRAFT_75145 [Galerina marginata CBS 339.88]
MTSEFNSPYNITITNDSPVVSYSPYRDGPSVTGWNLTCAGSLDSAWFRPSFCIGPSSHRSSFVGGTLTINFEGTAIYLYGSATSGSYTISIDGQINPSFASDASSGLLGAGVEMPFGKHSLVLSITQSSTVSFSQAILTVEVGRGDRFGLTSQSAI